MWCLILLAMFSSAIAQPVWGPYVVHDVDSTIKDVELCVRGDTADVVWIEGQVILHTNTELQNVGFTIPESLYWQSALNSPDLLYAQSFTESRSVCLLSQLSTNSIGGSTSLRLLSFGQTLPDVIVVTEDTYFYNPPNFGSGSYTASYSMRNAGGRVVVSMWSGSVTIFDTWFSTHVVQFDSSLTNGTTVHSGIQSPSIDSQSPVFGFPIGTNSAAILLEDNHWASSNLCIGPVSGGNDQICYNFDFDIPGIFRDGYLVDASRFLGYFSDNFLRRIIVVDSETVVFQTLPNPLPEDWSPSTAFHPSYGFAALQVHHARLFLARIDTSGQEVQPVGILYETDGTSFIVNADVTITDSGQVVAVWSEYTDWNEGPRTLKIAWTDWTTFLDTPEQTAPVVPQEFSLTAFPNPFNNSVTIQYDLPQASQVELSIFDIQGRIVETLRDNIATAGAHTLSWSPNYLSSGVYFARLNATEIQRTVKQLYIR